jgi:hypothetical protein
MLSLQAQKGWEAGAWIGASSYFGDLNNRLDLTKPGLAGGLVGRYNFNSRISAKSSLSYGRISAADEDSPNNFERNRNLSFSSNIFDLSSSIEFNFFRYEHGSEDYFFTPYLMLGFSIMRYNPRAELDGTVYDLRDFETEGVGYGNFSGGILIGGGWKWDINKDWSINIELSYRRVFTDYLDDVSTVYPNPANLGNQTARDLSDRSLIEGISGEGRQRGNSKDNDAYTFVGFSIMRYFGRLECPKISEPKW